MFSNKSLVIPLILVVGLIVGASSTKAQCKQDGTNTVCEAFTAPTNLQSAKAQALQVDGNNVILTRVKTEDAVPQSQTSIVLNKDSRFAVKSALISKNGEYWLIAVKVSQELSFEVERANEVHIFFGPDYWIRIDPISRQIYELPAVQQS